MSFSDKQTPHHQDTILQIKRKYINKTPKTKDQHFSRAPLTDKNMPSKDKYNQSPSKYLQSIAQSNIHTRYFISQNSNNESSRVNQESSIVSMRDYMNMKAEYSSKHRNDSTLTATFKNNVQNMYGNQPQSKQNRDIRRQFSKTNKVEHFGGEADNLANKWNKERNIKIKELKQAQRNRTNQGLDLKQKNHKIIDEIEQMVLRIRNSLKERNC